MTLLEWDHWQQTTCFKQVAVPMQVLRLPGVLSVTGHGIARAVQDAMWPQPVWLLPGSHVAHCRH
jgi:hypothetical protein